jgi:hypothetical protein
MPLLVHLLERRKKPAMPSNASTRRDESCVQGGKLRRRQSEAPWGIERLEARELLSLFLGGSGLERVEGVAMSMVA